MKSFFICSNFELCKNEKLHIDAKQLKMLLNVMYFLPRPWGGTPREDEGAPPQVRGEEVHDI